MIKKQLTGNREQFNKNRNQIARNISLFFILILCVIFSGCKKENKSEDAVSNVPVFAVNTVAAVSGQIQNYITLSGDIIAGSTVDVYSDAAGKVTQLFVSVGSRVNRGASIVAVDPSRPGMTFRQSIATAPISGTITAIPAQVGMTISQAVPLARIAGGGGLEIKLNVAERFISRMAVNLPCEVTLDAWPGDTFYGRVTEVSPTVDLTSRTMEMRVTVTDSGSKLKPGMFAKVKVITERKSDIVKIPSAAVINRFGEQYVYILSKDEENPEINIVRKRIVTQGIMIDGVAEIVDGLAADEEVVVRGQTLLDDGSRVNVIERVTPLSAN